MNSGNDPDIEKLVKREKRYRLLLDTMASGVQENDCEGTIIFSNRGHHLLLGYEYGELPGKKIWDLLISPEEQETLRKHFSTLVKEQPPPEPYLAQNRRKDGSLVNLQIDWNYEYDDDGILKGFISVITDITERRQNEENLLKRNKGLASLLEITRNLVATIDLQDVLQTSTNSVIELTGLDTAAIYLLEEGMLHLGATTPPLTQKAPDVFRITPLKDHPHIHEAITSGTPVLVSDMLTAELTPAERTITEQRNLRTVLFVPLVVDNRPLGTFIIGSVLQPSPISEFEIDLTLTLANLTALTTKNAQLYIDGKYYASQLEQMLDERTHAEKEKEKLQAQLVQAQKMETVGRLAGGVAHDFNNMLTIIFGYANLAVEKMDTNHPLHNYLTQICNAAQRSANLTGQLLAFARKQTIAPKLLDLNYTIDKMINMLHRLIGEYIELVWIPGDNLGEVKIDPTQIDQILANLCINSRDAISGGGKITIETFNSSLDDAYCSKHPGSLPGSYATLSVSDNGAGINQEIMSNIFDPFFSTKQTGNNTGLGLSTVYGIVKQNKAYIDVYSEPEHGTTIKVYLPIHENKVPETLQETSTQVIQGGSETILLVEDETMILDLISKMLQSLGYQVLVANSPKIALDLAFENRGTIDLLITDIVMPEMNGQELAEQLETAFPGLKTIYISGYTADVIANHGVLHPGVSFLAKPFSKIELATKIRETLKTKMSD